MAFANTKCNDIRWPLFNFSLIIFVTIYMCVITNEKFEKKIN